MSVYVMSMVFKRFYAGGNERLLALAIADCANDDGERIFPTMEALADKASLSVRSVQRMVRKMVDDGWLIMVGKHANHRYSANEYRINPDWISGKSDWNSGVTNADLRGDKLSPLDDSGVTPEVFRGDNCVTQEQSVNHHYVSSNEDTAPTTSKPSAKVTQIHRVRLVDGRFEIDAEVYERFEETYPGINLEDELAKSELWLASNPARRKKNLQAFLVNWLGRAQQSIDQATARGRALRGGR